MVGSRIRRFLLPERPARTAAPGTDSYTIAANDLGLYCVPLKAAHRPACRATLRGRVWEAQTIDFIGKQARDDIVHAGTFFGDMLPAFSRAFDHVWAFEPNADSFKCAKITLCLNDIANVTLVNAGLGARPHRASLTTEHNGEYLGGGSFMTEAPGNVAIVRIDDSIPADRPIGVIHLDVEGYEGEALAGALETIERWRPLILLETIPQGTAAMRSLSEFGYVACGKVDENFVFSPS